MKYIVSNNSGKYESFHFWKVWWLPLLKAIIIINGCSICTNLCFVFLGGSTCQRKMLWKTRLVTHNLYYTFDFFINGKSRKCGDMCVFWCLSWGLFHRLRTESFIELTGSDWQSKQGRRKYYGQPSWGEKVFNLV